MQKITHKRALLVLGLFAIPAIISGCSLKSISRRHSYHSSNPKIEIALLDGDMEAFPEGDATIERVWFSPNTWHPKPHHNHITLQLFYTEQNSEDRRYFSNAYHSGDDINIIWPDSKQDGEPVSLSFASKLGNILFTGHLGKADSVYFKNDVRSYGTFTIDINQDAAAKIKKAFGQIPSLTDTLSLIIHNTDLQIIIAYADCKVKFDITQAARLAEYNLTASDINKLIENGYRFNADNIIKLAQHHVSAEYALTWKNAGYNLSAAKLVYAKQRHLSAAMATDWKDAGYDADLETVYWIKQRHLDPKMATDWKDAGYDVDLEAVYWIKQRHLDPKMATDWKKAGYDVDLEAVYWIKQRHLSASEAGMWKKAGYNLSLDELYKLKQYHIGSDYGKAFANPDYEPLTVDELIKFKRSNISSETVNKLRKRK